MFLGGQGDMKRRESDELRWCKFVEYLHVFPTGYLRRRKGPAVPKETCKRWVGRKSLGDIFFQNHDDARHHLFGSFPSIKTETRRREHRVYWVPICLFGPYVCDGRNSELLNSMMTRICRNRNRPSSKMQNFSRAN